MAKKPTLQEQLNAIFEARAKATTLKDATGEKASEAISQCCDRIAGLFTGAPLPKDARDMVSAAWEHAYQRKPMATELSDQMVFATAGAANQYVPAVMAWNQWKASCEAHNAAQTKRKDRIAAGDRTATLRDLLRSNQSDKATIRWPLTVEGIKAMKDHSETDPLSLLRQFKRLAKKFETNIGIVIDTAPTERAMRTKFPDAFETKVVAPKPVEPTPTIETPEPPAAPTPSATIGGIDLAEFFATPAAVALANAGPQGQQVLAAMVAKLTGK